MRVLLWLALLEAAFGCAGLRVTEAIATHRWPTTAPLAQLSAAVDSADGFLLGTVERADEDWTYDEPCGILAPLRSPCESTSAYKLTIRSDTYPKRLYVFVPPMNYLALPVGTQAVFLWRWYYAHRYADCRARAGISQAECPTDRLPAVLSRDAVAAPSDSSYVAALWAGKPR